MTHTHPGAAPEHMYEPSFCNQALEAAGLDIVPPQTLAMLTTTVDPNRYLSHLATRMLSLDTITNPVARRLRQLRLQARISAKNAAKGIGCSDALLLMYERGDRDILNAPYDRVLSVAQFYGVPVSDITGAANTEMAAD